MVSSLNFSLEVLIVLNKRRRNYSLIF
jgi:hypothetical protein